MSRPPPPNKTARPLSKEDVKLWQKITRTVRPLPGQAVDTKAKSGAKPPLSSPCAQSSYVHLPPARKQVSLGAHVELAVRADKKTRRGKTQIDSKIDLHDLTLAQAFPLLERSVRRAHAQGARCVLVVTGKGVALGGVLRRTLPLWLEDERLRPLIAAYAQAHIRHGGAGAYYVFLKRRLEG